MRKSLLAGAAGALVAGPTLLAFFAGGFFDRPRLIAGGIVWVLAALVAVAAPRPLPAATPGRVALAALALLCAWTALSITWTPIGGRALDDLQRLLLYLGFLFCALALLRGSWQRRWLEPALALGATVVVAYGLSERLLPGLFELERSITAAGRLEQPISYWNGLGLLAAMGLVLAIRVAGDERRETPLQAGAAAAGVLLGLGVYLTLARGALAALAAGVLVLIALAPAGRLQLRAAVTILGAAALASLLASRFSTVQSLERGLQADAGDGAVVLAGLLVLAAAAAALTWRRPRRQIPLPDLPISRAAAVLTATGAVLVAATIVLAVFEGKPEIASPERGANPERLASVDTNRYRFWEVALEAWSEHPLVGVGSGGFQTEWLRQRDRVDTSGDAHSLYLETAAELGIVGLLLLAAFVGATLAGLVATRRRYAASAVGPAAALTAYAIHAGIDWDWELPAVTLPALLLAAAVLVWGERTDDPPTATQRNSTRRGARVDLVGMSECA